MDISSFLENCKNKHIVVLGDSMIDNYMWGKIERMSPEAPIPIVDILKDENRLGGAANVALNLNSLEANVTLVSLIGKDKNGDIFNSLLEENNLSSLGIITDSTRKTTVKTRIISDNKHVLRVDQEDRFEFKDTNKVLSKLKDIHAKKPIEVLVLQDYNKGLLSEKTISEAIRFCAENNIKTIVDPKKDNFFAYKNVDIFKPNLKEIQEALQVKCDPTNKESIINICTLLQKKINAKAIFLTLSENGVVLFKENKLICHPAHKRNIIDVSGAGDTVVSVAALALAQNLNSSDLAYISNLAGGLVCEEVGVVSISPNKLKNAL